jgi:2-methylisocitrate lyase-like PEP mutase family enzyme
VSLPFTAKRRSLKQALTEEKPLVTPVAHDALTARLIERAGFKAFAIGGSSMLAARYGLPDLGIAALGEMIEGARDIAGATNLPFFMDADDGYGGVKSVTQTMLLYQALGVGAVILEDQVRTRKRPGADHSSEIVPVDVMERKIRAAVSVRSAPEPFIIARSDALNLEGMDATLRRMDRYLKAGAEGTFITGLPSIEALQRVGSEFRNMISSVAMFETGPTPWLPPAVLFEFGFRQVSYPAAIVLRTVQAIDDALRGLSAWAKNEGQLRAMPNPPEVKASFDEAVHLNEWIDLDLRS